MVKVLLVAHWDWVLYNFRLPLAKALREHGYDVVFVCPFGEYVNKLMEAGFRCIHWSIIRRSVNPLEEIKALFHLAYIYRQERPNLVHHFTVKPNLLGSPNGTTLACYNLASLQIWAKWTQSLDSLPKL